MVGPVGLEPTTSSLSYHYGFHRHLRVCGLDYTFTMLRLV